MSVLKSLLVPSKAVTVDYPGLDGFKLDLSFLSRETLVSIRKKSTKFSTKRGAPTEDFDEKLFLKLYVDAAIKGWSGLTYAHLNTLAPVDIQGKDLTDELEYTAEDALDLMQASTDFDSFVSNTVTELSNFTKTSTKD
jgi:hypothetical protein